MIRLIGLPVIADFFMELFTAVDTKMRIDL